MGPGGPVEVLLGYLIMKKRVAYQGIKGSFSSMAARAMLGADFEALTTSRFRDIFEHVTSASADLTYIWVNTCHVYLTTVMGRFTREVLGVSVESWYPSLVPPPGPLTTTVDS